MKHSNNQSLHRFLTWISLCGVFKKCKGDIFPYLRSQIHTDKGVGVLSWNVRYFYKNLSVEKEVF